MDESGINMSFKILDHLEVGDLMADRGFQVEN